VIPDVAAAFAELRRRGLIALRNAGYTQGDGWADVAEHRHRAEQAGQRPRGGVFYHGQDAARAREGGPLYIAFGAFVDEPEHEAAAVAVAQEVVEVLRAHGFTVVWDGTAGQRIAIQPATPQVAAPPVKSLPIVRKAGTKKRG
jgi:hypothetical protein